VAVDAEHGQLVRAGADAGLAVIGAGPAGLIAAEHLALAGYPVTVYERMASPARKLLMAGRGGLNLTHSEDWATFLSRYGRASDAPPNTPIDAHLLAALDAWPSHAMTDWAHGLGIETFTGSSGRVFPRAMKASPLLRAWLRRLDGLGVRLAVNHEWRGFSPTGGLVFETPAGPSEVHARAVILALGGASWPRLGSNGAWAGILAGEGIALTPFAASNCGVHVRWSDHMALRFAGQPLKRIAVTLDGQTLRGEAIVTRAGLEGGVIYALAGRVRALTAGGQPAPFTLDLRPDSPLEDLTRRLSAPRGKQSMATFLRKTLSLAPVAIALLHEAGPLPSEPAALAARVKGVRLTATGAASLERAISTAGGLPFSALDENFMLTSRPGLFAAGEMLDWDAPTGGYLLQASFATGVAAARGALKWLGGRPTPS
jgi:uncharacterized flavoprotein (TIGR03862 family)